MVFKAKSNYFDDYSSEKGLAHGKLQSVTLNLGHTALILVFLSSNVILS